jgi:uncharacterized RDD family membrane protein YckC
MKMKNAICNRSLLLAITMLGLLVMLGMTANRAVAQTNEPAISVSVTNSTQAPIDTNKTNIATVSPITNTAAVTGRAWEGGNHSGRDRVVFGRSNVLPAGETADDMVTIGGSATALGRVRQDLVAIWGNVTVSNEVGGDTVAVLGNIKLETNAVVHGDTVAVLGDIKLGPNAKVHGDVVAVGGAVERAEGAVIDGEVVGFPGFSWLGEWLQQCAFKLRPLAPQLGWLWAITGVVLLIYLLIAIAFPRPVQACADEITRRPVSTILVGLLTKILLPFVLLILVATGVGILVVPFLLIAVMVMGMFGKVALLEYFGQQIGRQLNLTVFQRPLLAFLLGWVLITLFYLVPVLGLITYALTGMGALGAAVMALFSGRRREAPDKPVAPAAYGPPPTYNAPTTIAVAETPPTPSAPPANPETSPQSAPEPSGSPEPPSTTATVPPIQSVPAAPPVTPPTLPELLSYPKAGFWERMGAAFLDIVLVGILGAIVGGLPFSLVVALAYFAGMWAWKGTTIGGIVLKLQVVRADGQPVNFVVALVRGLAAAFSMAVLFLGFLWIAWDRDKQGWHDKIAGTTVVRLPRSIPLVCV